METKTMLYSCDEQITLAAQEEAVNGWQELKNVDGTSTRSMRLWMWEVTWVRYTAEEQELIDNPPKLTRAEILAKAREAKKVKGANDAG